MMASYKNTSNQQGFALATVLIVLLILAVIVAALLSNQTLAMRETSDVLTSATRAQESHNVHRTCLKWVRDQMSEEVLRKVSPPVDWRKPFDVSSNGVKGTCQIEAAEVDAALLGSWTPQLRITTVVNGQVEISDWRYAPCTPMSACLSNAQTQLMIKKLDGQGSQTLTPTYLLGVPVQTAWRKQ